MYLLNNMFVILLAFVISCMFVVLFVVTHNRGRRALIAQAGRLIREKVKMSRSSHGFLNSMKAEELVETALREAGWKHVFLRRRVHVARLGHNREIDVIAVGPVILVVEVKNWQGYVWSNGSQWFQKSGQTRNKTLEFEDVEQDNVEKAASLRRYIENTCRIPLPDFIDSQGSETSENEYQTNSHIGTWYSNKSTHTFCGKCVIPVIVFTNNRVKLDPLTMKSRKMVFTLTQFQEFATALYKYGLANGCASHATSCTTFANYTHLNRINSAQSSNTLITTANIRYTITIFIQIVRNWYNTITKINHYFIGELVVLHRLKAFYYKLCYWFSYSDRHTWMIDHNYLLDSRFQQRVASVIDNIRTWDLVYLHNGELFTGDVQNVQLTMPALLIERKHIVDMRFCWSVGWRGVLHAIFANGTDVLHITLLPAAFQGYSKKKLKELVWDDNGNVHMTIKLNDTSRKNSNKLVIKAAGTQ